MDKAKVILEQNKAVLSESKGGAHIRLFLSDRAHSNLRKQQSRFEKKTGGKISLNALSVQLLEKAAL